LEKALHFSLQFRVHHRGAISYSSVAKNKKIIDMKDILKFDKCPVSGLKIITKPEWKYTAKDGSCTLEIAVIGDDILYETPIGIVDGEANKWYVKTANKIISEYFGDRKYYLAYDYSLLKKASLESKKIFINWLVLNSDEIEMVTVFGMNQIMKVAIKTARIISKKYNKLLLTNSYEDSINAILQNQGKLIDNEEFDVENDNILKDDEQTENSRINELIGYLGNMTWTGDLNQKIPVLTDEDPFAELFAAVAANQEDLREIERDRNEAYKKSEKLILEKDKALESLSDSEMVMLSLLKDVKAQEIETKKANEQFETIIKGANLGWWDWDLPSGDEIYNEILTENLGYKLSEVTLHNKWWEGKIHPDDEKKVYEDLQKHFDEETEYYENKHRLKTKSGEWKWFADFGKVIERDETGKPIRMIGILRDIDKEERAEKTLRQSEEKFKGLFTGMSLGVIFCEAVYDENRNMIDCIYRDMNSAYEKFTNINKDTAIGCRISELLPEAESQWLPVFGEVVRTGEPISFEMYNAPSEKHYLVFAYRSKKDNFTAIFEDVTERIVANKQIKKLSTAVEQTANTIVITDTKGNIEYTNPQFSKITGYTAEEAVGENPRILNAGTQSKEYYANMWKTINDGDIWHGEFHNKSKTGKLYWEAVTITPIKEDGEIINFLAIKQDITKQKKSDEQIRKFSQVVETTSQSVVITNLEGNIVFVNEALIKTAGFDNESEIIGKSIYAFTDEYGVAKLKNEILPKIFDIDFFYEDEINIRKKDNTFFPAEISGSIIKDEAGKSEFFVVMFNDISNRKQVEEELKAANQQLTASQEQLLTSESFLKNILNSIQDGISVSDTELTVQLANKKLEEWYKDNLPLNGKKCYEVYHNKKKPCEPCPVLRSIESGKTERDVMQGLPGSPIKWIELFSYPMKDKTGKIIGVAEYVRDITESKQAEKDLISAKEKAEESNRLKTAFLNNMSHEIRTPLNGITGFLALLQEPSLDDEHRQEYFDIINKSSNRLITTVSDIIEISKIEAGIIDISITKVSINAMLCDLYGFFSLEAKKKGLKLMQLPTLSSDEAIVLTDNHKLNGILTNLVKNAIKFTDKGGVTFGYKITTDSEGGLFLQFFVKDTGIGIPKERQKAIFNRFEQADIEDTRVFEGSGLGLAISKSYVEILGGNIWLNTEEGVGTEFMFTIPYKTKTGKTKKIKQQNKPENKLEYLKPLTVLIVEDDDVSNQLFGIVFKKTFKRTIFVETGQQAIDACKNNPEIDLVLMDIKMPEMNGYTATREIRKFNKEIIIIAQTAFGLEGDNKKAIEAGCNDYIAKPIKKNLLFEKIKLYF